MNDDLNKTTSSSTENKILDESKEEKVSFKKEDKFKVKLDEKKEDNA